MNPQQISPQLHVDEEACLLCARCLVAKACRGMAIIRIDRDEAPIVDMARCRQCWACMGICPADTLTRS